MRSQKAREGFGSTRVKTNLCLQKHLQFCEYFLFDTINLTANIDRPKLQSNMTDAVCLSLYKKQLYTTNTMHCQSIVVYSYIRC